MAYPRPAADEYAPYYETYIARVRDGDIIKILAEQSDAMRGLFARVPNDRGQFAYAPGKWTLKEVLLHCADAERISAYRALRIARGDATDLPGWDEKAYAPASGATARSFGSLLDELESVRDATVTLFEGLPAAAWTRRGTANGAGVSVRALAWITAGHLLHHLAIVQERYLG